MHSSHVCILKNFIESYDSQVLEIISNNFKKLNSLDENEVINRKCIPEISSV